MRQLQRDYVVIASLKNSHPKASLLFPLNSQLPLLRLDNDRVRGGGRPVSAFRETVSFLLALF